MSGSWQRYVDDLIYTGSIASGAIIGLNDGAVSACSPNLSLKPGEAAAIATLFKNPSSVRATGVTIGGTKYIGMKGEENTIIGKKGQSGAVLVKTNELILMGLFNEGVTPDMAENAVRKQADYLKENGY